MHLITILKTFRPSFLLLTPICVLLGLALATTSSSHIDILLFTLVMSGSILAHISVNVLNEYLDFKSGLDLQTRTPPFSGGSGALPEAPQAARSVLVTGILSLALTVAIGLYLVSITGWPLLPIGLIGLALIIFYTKWINRSPFLCLVSPGTGFGLLIIPGTYG